MLLLLMLWGCTLLPLPLRWDVRGWTEMHPLNGPCWSLYYEYIANILYALFIRRFSKKALAVLVFLAACLTVYRGQTAPLGDMVGGWALTWEQQYVGFVRLLYPFFGGLLLSRLGWLIRVKKRAFWYCSLIIVCMLSVPRLGGEEHYWMNGLYESFCILFLFPLIVSMGAGGKVTGSRSTAICKFLGDISYPIYITHYPLVYVYTAWVCNTGASITDGIPYMVLVFVGAVTLAYVSLRPPLADGSFFETGEEVLSLFPAYFKAHSPDFTLFVPIVADDAERSDFSRVLDVRTDAQAFVVIAHVHDAHCL